MHNKLKIEFIGTFFLVLAVAFTGNPLAIGAMLTALLYMGGYISGAHYNPAVTITMWVTDKIKLAEAMKYIVTQFVAALLAAGIYNIVSQRKMIPMISPEATIPSAFIVELLCTFLLCTVVLHVAATNKTKGNDYFGIAIGFTLMAIAFIGGPISGGAFNPAVGISPLLYDFANIGSHLTTISIYLLGPIGGGILAGLVYKSMNK